jgi:hypothetical protein
LSDVALYQLETLGVALVAWRIKKPLKNISPPAKETAERVSKRKPVVG